MVEGVERGVGGMAGSAVAKWASGVRPEWMQGCDRQCDLTRLMYISESSVHNGRYERGEHH